MNDLIFYGGLNGVVFGNQQFTVRNLTSHNTVTAIDQIWDWGWTYTGIAIINCTKQLHQYESGKFHGSRLELSAGNGRKSDPRQHCFDQYTCCSSGTHGDCSGWRDVDYIRLGRRTRSTLRIIKRTSKTASRDFLVLLPSPPTDCFMPV